MKIRKLVCLALVGTMISSMPVFAAVNEGTQTAINADLIDAKGSVDLKNYDESNSIVNVSDISSVAETDSLAAIGVRYPWSYDTYPYDFTSQKWSTNLDIYDTYASTTVGDFPNAKYTYHLSNPTGPISYSNAIREGFIRQAGELQLFDHVVTGVNNNIMLMMDANIKYGIVEKSTLVSVFSEQSNKLIGGTTETRNVGGRDKTILNLQLQKGEYLLIFSADDVAKNNHYALYTGCPLPILQTSMHAGTHNGVVHWNGGGLKEENEVICPSIGISVPSGIDPALFALHKVWFEDKSMGGSQDLYVSSVKYYYKSPANYSYKQLNSDGGYHGNLYDNTPSSSSVEGSYGTKFYVNWSSSLGYVGASFHANTMMHLEYLTPYGLYKGM
jgi:hypothetical protein